MVLHQHRLLVYVYLVEMRQQPSAAAEDLEYFLLADDVLHQISLVNNIKLQLLVLRPFLLEADLVLACFYSSNF